ncbi:MAG TPA: MotA/TolQ/ExbB proton channel family protein [Nitrospira sp.]|nr:MotA/TolQ/ExbB proton channel family protein [Nitrospira sp.]
MGLLGSLGVVSKVVLLLLFLLSVLSWAVILLKWKVFRAADAEDHRFMAVLAKSKDVDEVARHAHRSAGSPCAKIFHGVVDRLGSGQEAHEGGSAPAVDRHVVERTAQHLAQGQLSQLEAYLPFLATTGNISPFVGLLGTVMGIIDSFREIGSQGTASIAAVAPGVSEALVATAAGLFTAIPAVIAYNYFLSRIRGTAFRMDSVTVELLAMLASKPKPGPGGAKG